MPTQCSSPHDWNWDIARQKHGVLCIKEKIHLFKFQGYCSQNKLSVGRSIKSKALIMQLYVIQVDIVDD